MLKIYLVRHGQDEDNLNGILNGRRDKPLTDKGVKQAKELSLKIKESDIKFDEIYSSPLKRALKTAEIIADEIGLDKPKTIEDLQEREFGIMTGKLINKITELCSPDILETENVTYFLNPEGAETFPQLIRRADKVLKEIKTKHKNGNILLATHGDIGKMIYATYYKLDWKKILKMFHFGNSDMLLLSSDSKPEDTHVFKIEQ